MAALYRCWIFIQAVTIAFFEQLLDVYQAACEKAASQTPPASERWLQAKAFLFQYSVTGDPDTSIATILPDTTVGYVTVDPSLRIITRCSVVTTGNNNVAITVAKSDPPVAMSSPELAEFYSYMKAHASAGVYFTLFSGNSDKVAIYANVYFQPGYGGVAKANVEAALKKYLDSIAISDALGSRPVNYQGIIKNSEIENFILNAGGIADVEITKVIVRSDTTLFVNGTKIYDLANGIDLRVWNCIAGYAEQETDSGHTWADTITYAPE